jgi:hypothetical protein
MKQIFIFLLVLLLSFNTKILNKRQSRHHNLRERRLSVSKLKKTYFINQLNNKHKRKLNFMKVVLKILKNAHKNNLNIKNIKFGSGIKKVFKNPFMVDDMKSFLTTKKLNSKIKVMEKKIKKEERNLKVEKTKEKKQNKRKLSYADMAKKAAGAATSAATGGAKKEEGAGGSSMGFNFLPGFAGMPFPPFMMQGPHFHPPINMTVNSIPNPNPQADLNPFEIEQSNLSTQLDELSNIKSKLIGLGSKMNSVDQQINDGLEDKYTKIMQLNV